MFVHEYKMFIFFFSFHHWNPYCNPKILPSPEIIGLERKQKQFWNQTTTENKLGTCRMLGADFDETRRGSPVDRRPSSDEASPTGKILPLQ